MGPAHMTPSSNCSLRSGSRDRALCCARAFVLAAVSQGCAATTPAVKAAVNCPPQAITISLLTAPRINPAPNGEARAVVVRVYQLTSDVRISNARFEQIWKDDKLTLGDELVKVDEQEVYPGTRVDLSFDRLATVQNVAAVALFQNPQGRSWVASAELPPPPIAAEACSAKACEPDDEACRTRAVAAPKLSFFMDGNKIDDGVEHLDQFPSPGPIRERP